MFGADSMPRTHDTAFEKGKSGFDRVGMDVSHNVDMAAVLNGLVLGSRHSRSFHSEGIRSEIVGHNNFNIFADILTDELCNCSGFHIACVEHTKIAIALSDPDYDFLVSSAPGLSLGLTASGFSANIGFVHLDSAAQFRLASFEHRGSDAMAEVPCGFVGLDSQRPLNLAGRHALLGFAEQYGGEKPCHKRQVRIMEDRVHGDAELVFA